MVLFRKGFQWKLLLPFGLAGIITTYLGASIVVTISEQTLLRILGVFLVAYVIFLFAKPTFKIPKNTISAVSGGAASGFFASLFGVGGAIRSVFLTAFNLPKSVYIMTAGAIAFVIDTTRITTYLLNNIRLDQQLLWGLLLFVPMSFTGAYFAKKIVNRIPQQKFRMVVAVFLFLVGAKFIIFPG